VDWIDRILGGGTTTPAERPATTAAPGIDDWDDDE